LGDFWSWHVLIGVEILADAIGPIANAEDLDFYIRKALIGESEIVGNWFCNVKHATTDEGSTVVDANFGRATIFKVGDANDTRNGQGFVGRNLCPRPEVLSSGGLTRKNEKMFGVVRGDTDLCMADGVAGLHGVVTNASNCVGLGFVAFDVRPEASGERQAKCGDESEEESLLKNSCHSVVRGFNNCSAAIREEGMRPQ